MEKKKEERFGMSLYLNGVLLGGFFIRVDGLSRSSFLPDNHTGFPSSYYPCQQL